MTKQPSPKRAVDIRISALDFAVRLGGKPEEVVGAARLFEPFLLGDDANAPAAPAR